MPYELFFSKVLIATEPDDYINECCYSGDIIGNYLLPEVAQRYQKIEFAQEDWGWFIWFSSGNSRLAIDIFCDDAQRGEYRLMLTSREKRFLLPDRIVDTAELETVKTLVASALERWSNSVCRVERA